MPLFWSSINEEIYGFGSNTSHQLGIEGEHHIPVPIERESWGIESKIVQIQCGNNFTMMITGTFFLSRFWDLTIKKSFFSFRSEVKTFVMYRFSSTIHVLYREWTVVWNGKKQFLSNWTS
jgi:hypothetical protein